MPFMKQCAKKNTARAAQATDNTAHAQCMLDTQGYNHTLRICNAYWFSTVTMVARTRLDVTLYEHWLPFCVLFSRVVFGKDKL